MRASHTPTTAKRAAKSPAVERRAVGTVASGVAGAAVAGAVTAPSSGTRRRGPTGLVQVRLARRPPAARRCGGANNAKGWQLTRHRVKRHVEEAYEWCARSCDLLNVVACGGRGLLGRTVVRAVDRGRSRRIRRHPPAA